MLERGSEGTTLQPALPGTVISGRFARAPGHFALKAPDRPQEGIDPGPPRAPEAIVEAAFAAALDEDGR
jgi:hypothetical protein